MKILQITDHWYPDKIGGSCKYAYELARALEDNITTTTTISTKSHPEEEGLHVLKILSRRKMWLNIISIKKNINIDDYDSIVFHSVLMLFYIAPYLMAKRKPFTLIYHGPWTQEFYYKARNLSGPTKFALLLWPAYYIIELIANLVTKNYILLSTRMLHDIRSLFPVKGNISIIPYFSDFKAKHEYTRQTKPPYKLLTIRRLEYRMGIQRLFLAIASLAPEVRPTLNIVGEGPYRRKLEELASTLDIDQSVNFLGRVAQGKINDLYSESDFFVMPSIKLEGFGIVVLEAAEAGIPCIISKEAGFAEYVTPPLDKQVLIFNNQTDLRDIMTKEHLISFSTDNLQNIFDKKKIINDIINAIRHAK